MKRILFTWLAVINDFNKEGRINEAGPNVNMHAYHWDYDQHIILYTENYQDRALYLLNYLRKNFSNHKVNARKIDVEQVYVNLPSMKNKIEALLIGYSDWEIDLLLSTGTGLMKIAWYVAHSTLKLKTKLLMLLAPKDSKDPFEPDLFEISVEQSHTPVSALIRENNLSKKVSDANRFISKSLKLVYERAFKIAQADSVSVLILGNTGTGKEVLANYIHTNSARKNKPFITVNCSAFSDQLLESRLFGHKKGSFTGAYNNHKGFFEQANGGTVFLDEIGDISIYMQQLLLRFLQEKEIQPIGGRTKKVDVRIIAATNKNIGSLIKEQKFRSDLYYRLGITLNLPDFNTYTTEEKKEWIDFLITEKKNEFGRKSKIELSDELKTFMLSYNFNGNIRELMNIIDNFYVFSSAKATIKDLPAYMFDNKNDSTLLKLADVEYNHIKKVLKMYGNNKSKAAKALGIALNTLKNKIKE